MISAYYALSWRLWGIGGRLDAPNISDAKKGKPVFESNNDVLVYQMGKVGSSSIKKTLVKAGFSVKHFHYAAGTSWDRRNRPKGIFGVSRLRDFHGKIITLTRDPISRNISAFFQNLQAFGINVSDKPDIQHVIDVFFDVSEKQSFRAKK